MKVYLASNYAQHPLMREWAAVLKAAGHVVTSTWINGEHSAKDGLEDHRFNRFIAETDTAEMDAADVLVLDSRPELHGTGRGGRHTETGWMLKSGKLVVLVGEPEGVFHYLPRVRCVPTIRDAAWLLGLIQDGFDRGGRV